ncbi:cysteine-rich secretory protein LCCL domain-containing 1-like, partial [Hippocampus comes]|uniref:cysteine-rich secretory protein LCCL domain-containing 1-like n=1 Tax=Hippocampus comes TaxID=109280 RepID=UPI00094E8D63
GGVDRRPAPETEETNYIEPEPDAVREREAQPRPRDPDRSPPSEDMERKQVISTEQMCQQMDCDTKLRDRCKGTTCN